VHSIIYVSKKAKMTYILEQMEYLFLSGSIDMVDFVIKLNCYLTDNRPAKCSILCSFYTSGTNILVV
jgi:hypothetical protein